MAATERPGAQLVRVAERPLDTRHGDFRAHVFREAATGAVALALARGDLRAPAPLLARVHSSCVTSETYGGCDCDCAGQLDEALRRIARAGRGVAFYLLQEGRGAGFAAKARDRMIVQASRHRITTFEAYEMMGLGGDQRRYEQVAAACALLGIRAPLRLLTNNPDKRAAVEALGLEVACTLPLREEASPFNGHYLASKSRSGHALDARRVPPAELPEPVHYFDPHPLPGAPGLLRVASYLLPIRLPGRRGDRGGPGPHWFRLHLYLDLDAHHERAVLTYGARGARSPLVRVQCDALLARFPRRGGSAREGWLREASAMVERGAGCAAFLPTRLEAGAADPTPDAATARLLAHHLGGGAAVA